MEQANAIFYNAFVMWLVATIGMLTYSYRSNGNGFDFKCWFKTNTNRFIVGAIIIVGLSVLIVIAPDTKELLGLVGFNVDKTTPVALGLAISAFLIAGISGNCIHEWRFFRNIYGDEINHSGGKRSVWRCDKCGSSDYRDSLFKEEKEKENV